MLHVLPLGASQGLGPRLSGRSILNEMLAEQCASQVLDGLAGHEFYHWADDILRSSCRISCSLK